MNWNEYSNIHILQLWNKKSTYEQKFTFRRSVFVMDASSNTWLDRSKYAKLIGWENVIQTPVY